MVKVKEKRIEKGMGQETVEGKEHIELREGVINGKEKGEIYWGRNRGKGR